MFNPYLSSLTSALQQVPIQRDKDLLGGLLSRLRSLDSDDLILLLILYLLVKDGKDGSLWPMAAVVLYLIL